LAPGEYFIIPEIVYFNQFINQLFSVKPVFPKEHTLNGRSFFWSIILSNSIPEVSLDLSELLDLDISNTVGGVYFLINNNSGTGISIWNGDVQMFFLTGMTVINPGSSGIVLLFFQMNPDDTIPESQSLANLSIGTNPLRQPVPAFVFELDYLYTINVTGSNPADLQLGAIVKGEKIDLF